MIHQAYKPGILTTSNLNILYTILSTEAFIANAGCETTENEIT
jgi:hypothetical protein